MDPFPEVHWSITYYSLTYSHLGAIYCRELGESHNQESNKQSHGWPSCFEVTALQTDPVRGPYMLFLNDNMMESSTKSKNIFQMRSLTLDY